MGIFNKLRGGSGGYTGQPPAKAQFGGGMPGSLPPGPPARTKLSGPLLPISSMSQADKANRGIQQNATDARMKGDQHRSSGNHASADAQYRAADEIESRLKQGAPQLDANAMSKIKSTQGMSDQPGSGWGRSL